MYTFSYGLSTIFVLCVRTQEWVACIFIQKYISKTLFSFYFNVSLTKMLKNAETFKLACKYAELFKIWIFHILSFKTDVAWSFLSYQWTLAALLSWCIILITRTAEVLLQYVTFMRSTCFLKWLLGFFHYLPPKAFAVLLFVVLLLLLRRAGCWWATATAAAVTVAVLELS